MIPVTPCAPNDTLVFCSHSRSQTSTQQQTLTDKRNALCGRYCSFAHLLLHMEAWGSNFTSGSLSIVCFQYSENISSKTLLRCPGLSHNVGLLFPRCKLLSWYFEPSQPQRITSGLKLTSICLLLTLYTNCQTTNSLKTTKSVLTQIYM